jgi:hypothetical protein
MNEIDLSTAQVAERLGVSAITVRLWCRRGLFPNAYAMPTARGPLWVVPAGDLKGFEPPKKTGRPPKATGDPTAAKPAETTAKLNKAFREAKEAEEASQKTTKKRSTKK